MLCLAAAAAAFALLIVHGFWSVLAAWSIVCICEGACTPLLDVATLKTAARSGFAFSTPRAAAASAAIVSGVTLGALFAAHGPGVLPAWSLIGLLVTAGFIALFVTAENGSQTAGRNGALSEPGAADPMAPALLIMVILAAGLIQLSHGMNGMAMLGWRARGISEAWCGVLWQTGTVADIAFLWLLSRYSIAPSRLLMLGGLGAAARWAIFALSPPMALLFLAQTLHALSFTATYIATVQLIDRLVADRGKLLAQSLYWAISTGFCTGVGVAGGGVLYQWAGNGGYWAMCALALIGLAGAGSAHVCLRGRPRSRRPRVCPAYAK
jgi:PPP family 3-phenylpropionic acid transporter